MIPAQQWAAQRVAGLPGRWAGQLLRQWDKRRGQLGGGDFPEIEAERAANLDLLRVSDGLQRVRVSLDASDIEICTRADKMADACLGRAQLWGAQLGKGPEQVRAAMERLCRAQGVEPPKNCPGKKSHVEDAPAMARMCCPLWWRRKLRRVHAVAVESAAIHLGHVNKARGLYCSDESLTRRLEQNRRNAASLEATIARNENGQEYTLAELAATSTANKAIRRAELMTRIAGFERVARDLGHMGLFFTMTCPSRMHKWKTAKGGGVIENRRYDGTTPAEAQKHLAKTWARIRSKLAREGVRLYGFRIAEPNHDGTPHWHILAFHAPSWPGAPGRAMLPRLAAIIRRYALADSGQERGAKAHRVDFEPIDWSKGSAAGYVAKYVAKNIDGYRVGEDLHGNDAMESSARVEAWAATWGIRQFQQVGGPPVTVWRELRRVEAIPAGAPDHLRLAHDAVNKTAVIEGRDNASVAWDHYCKAQGGVFMGRDYRIKVAKVDQGKTGRYGESLGAQPVGVETSGIEHYTPAHMAHMGVRIPRVVHWFVESVRHTWEIVSRVGRGAASGLLRAISAPWTRVNNCTDPNDEREPESGDSGRKSEMGTGPGPYSHDGGALRGADPGRGGCDFGGTGQPAWAPAGA